jgi:hypothetical protein
MPIIKTTVIEEAISFEWAERLTQKHAGSILQEDVDSHCGQETLRIIRLAEFVAAEWPDASGDVYTAAVHQIHVVWFG